MALPKLLFYTPGLVDGGAERLWACLASAFARRGYEVVFAVDFEAPENKDSLDPAIPCHVLGSNHFTATHKLARLIARERPRVALSAVAGSNLKMVLAARLSGAAPSLIASYHGFEEPRTGRLSYLTYKLLPILSRQVARIVTVSDELSSSLVAEWGADPSVMATLPNPVLFPDETAVPGAAELAARDDIVLAAGRLVPEKDYLTLIRAFSRIGRPEAQLVILGKGPEKPRLKAEIERLGLGGRVVLPGYVPEPWRYFKTAKCFAVSSRTESFGNVVVEALAHGLPVVSTACSGPLELLDQGRIGRIVSVGDEAALAAALTAALDHPGEGRPRRARAEQYSFASRLPAYEALIQDVLADAEQPVAMARVAAASGT